MFPSKGSTINDLGGPEKISDANFFFPRGSLLKIFFPREGLLKKFFSSASELNFEV